MLIGRYFKNIKPEYRKHYFSGISFNSQLCKSNNIFLAIKGFKLSGLEPGAPNRSPCFPDTPALTLALSIVEGLNFVEFIYNTIRY